MKTVQISLNSIDKVKSFVNDITKFDYDFDLVSGRYVIDAKSIMGIFSLDLSIKGNKQPPPKLWASVGYLKKILRKIGMSTLK